MGDVPDRSSLEDLRREVGRICDGQGAFHDVREVRDFRAFEPAPPDSRLHPPVTERGPFGRWLMQQEGATDAMAMLVDCARRDPKFPKDGDPESVRKRLRECMADGDMFASVDEAEMDWMSY